MVPFREQQLISCNLKYLCRSILLRCISYSANTTLFFTSHQLKARRLQRQRRAIYRQLHNPPFTVWRFSQHCAFSAVQSCSRHQPFNRNPRPYFNVRHAATTSWLLSAWVGEKHVHRCTRSLFLLCVMMFFFKKKHYRWSQPHSHPYLAGLEAYRFQVPGRFQISDL